MASSIRIQWSVIHHNNPQEEEDGLYYYLFIFTLKLNKNPNSI